MTANVLKGVDSVDLKCLDDTLWEWLHVTERYCRAMNWEDAPWWYNERASLSILAAAIWRAGGIAFEEFSTEKHELGARESKNAKTYAGRCDLYLKVVNTEFIAESKHIWSHAGEKAANPKRPIEEALKQACEEARQIKSDIKNRLGIVFAAPCISTSFESTLDDLLARWVFEIRRQDCHALAWCIPSEARTKLVHGGVFHPGIAVFIRKA